MDKLTKVLSVVISILMLGPLVWVRFVAYGTPRTVILGLVALDVGLVVLCYTFAPQGYSLLSGELRIHRGIGDKVIPLTGLTEVRQLDARAMRGTARLFGVSGLFGHYGKMSNRALGTHTWYATRRGNYVYLAVGGKKLVLTPDNPARMAKALEAYVHRM